MIELVKVPKFIMENGELKKRDYFVPKVIVNHFKCFHSENTHIVEEKIGELLIQKHYDKIELTINDVSLGTYFVSKELSADFRSLSFDTLSQFLDQHKEDDIPILDSKYKHVTGKCPK